MCSYKSGNWTLSPAYDLTFAYAPGSRWLSGHQMTVAGKTNKITEEDLISCGKEMGLSEERALEVYKGIKEAADA